MTPTNATRSVQNWKREKWHDTSTAEAMGAKLFRIEMRHTYAGVIEGEGTVQYLSANNGAHNGCFVALEQVTGSVGGRFGSFVFQQTGTIEHGTIKITLVVAPGLGTGQLRGLRGKATIECDQHEERYPIVFEYELVV